MKKHVFKGKGIKKLVLRGKLNADVQRFI